MLTNKITLSSEKVLNFLIFFIPVSIILGNLITNINIFFICLFGLIKYRLQIFKLDQKILLYLLYSFFAYLILITLIKFIPSLYDKNLYIDSYKYDAAKASMIKSFLYVRYLIFFLVINKLIEQKALNIKHFFISSAFCSLVLALDIIIQVVTGKDLLGYPLIGNTPSGFFGTELVAGGYLQKFSLFFIFYGLFFWFNSLKKKIFFLIITFLFFLGLIVITNNRMPVLLFFASIFVFCLIERKIRKYSFIIVALSLIPFFLVTKFNVKYSHSIDNFYNTTKQIIQEAPKLFYYGKFNEKWYQHISKKNIIKSGPNGHLLVFNTGIQQWKESKLFGSGLKSTKINCKYNIEFVVCSSHPHNYIIEIFLDVGIIGFILIYTIFIYAVLNFKKFYKKNSNSKLRFISMPFFLIIFLEFFPLRSSGSFFTTSNAVLIFLFLAFLINSSRLYFVEKKI